MIWLAQLLCPRRHCLCAFAYYEGEFEQAKKEAEHGFFQVMKVNRWCGICGSKDVKWESRETPFTTIEQAMPVLKAGEIEQALTRMQLDADGQTFDIRKMRNN